MYTSWWVLNRQRQLFLHLDDQGLDEISMMELDVCIYVAKMNTDIENVRNQFMKYIGGQYKIQCFEHKLPFIVSDDSSEKCYQHSVGEINICKRNISFKCPYLSCTSGICKKCFKKLTSDEIQFIQPPVRNIQHVTSDEQSQTSESDDSDEHADDSDEENYIDPVVPREIDDINDFVIDGGVDEIPSDEVVSEYFPTTLAGNVGYFVEEDTPKFNYVSGHVIMNQCGSLLNHNDREIIGYRSQKFFLQRIASVTDGNTLPLIYPEAMMFPSIFWSMVSGSGSMLGAIPSGLLVKSDSHGFASMKSHFRCRLRHPGSSTSTNSSYISFMYDILVNLTLNREDSRIILNRGLMESTSDTGLKIRSRDDSLLSDCVDNKQTVRNLCASQMYHKMDFF